MPKSSPASKPTPAKPFDLEKQLRELILAAARDLRRTEPQHFKKLSDAKVAVIEDTLDFINSEYRHLE